LSGYIVIGTVDSGDGNRTIIRFRPVSDRRPHQTFTMCIYLICTISKSINQLINQSIFVYYSMTNAGQQTKELVLR